MVKSLSMAGCVLLVCGTVAPGEERVVPLKGAYKEIDTTREIQAITTFLNGSERQKERLAEKIQEQPNRYAPAVFFHLANYLYEQDETDDALFWLYAGRIRTWYDIKRCTDPSVGDSIEVLNGRIPPLLRLAQFEDLGNAKRLMKKAISWDRKTPHDYDARWIALHGIRASLPEPADGTAAALTIPEDQWETLAETHRKEYLKTFQEDLASLTPEQLAQIEAKIEELEAAEKEDDE